MSTSKIEMLAAETLKTVNQYLQLGTYDHEAKQTIVIGKIVGVLCATAKHYKMTRANLIQIIKDSWDE